MLVDISYKCSYRLIIRLCTLSISVVFLLLVFFCNVLQIFTNNTKHKMHTKKSKIRIGMQRTELSLISKCLITEWSHSPLWAWPWQWVKSFKYCKYCIYCKTSETSFKILCHPNYFSLNCELDFCLSTEISGESPTLLKSIGNYR